MSPTMTTFDTSGVVRIYTNVGEPGGARKRDWRWPDLSPFERGYVRAMFASGIEDITSEDIRAGTYGFSDLAPETLARIMEDCASFLAKMRWPDNAYNGGQFWQARALGRYTNFPPLTLHLSNDGKVRFA